MLRWLKRHQCSPNRRGCYAGTLRGWTHASMSCHRSVLLLEAEPDYPDLTHPPEELKYGSHQATSQAGAPHNWSFLGQATPRQPRPIPVPRGEAVGGTSAINHQIFLRGPLEDYDGWAALGNAALCRYRPAR